jgi:hypothetical protein
MGVSLRGALRWGMVPLLASSGLLVVAESAGAQPDSGPAAGALIGEYHRIQNAGSGLCLQPEASPGIRILQMTCTGKANQGWLMLNDSNSRYRFLSGTGRGCVSVNDTPINTGAVQLDNCTNSDGSGRAVSNAQWKATGSVPGNVVLRTRVGNVDNNYCLDVPGGSWLPGLAMQLYACNDTFAQRWVVGLG